MADETNTISDLSDLRDITGGAAEAAPEGEAAPVMRTGPEAVMREQELDAQGRAYATGRRKDAVARVWLKPGSGKITINGRDQEVYFARPTLRLVINQVFGVTEREGQYDVVCTVKGGGLSGQAIVRIAFDGTNAREAERFAMGQRIRELEQHPDGSVYVLEDERNGSGGRLLRLVPRG